IVNGNDIGLAELACGARFLLEASQPVGIVGEYVGQDFKRHLATQPGVPRAIHLAHPARTKRRYDFVRTKFSTGTEHSDLSLHSGISPARSRSGRARRTAQLRPPGPLQGALRSRSVLTSSNPDTHLCADSNSRGHQEE